MSSNLQAREIVYLVGAGILIMVLLVLVILVYTSRAQRRILLQRMQHDALELRFQQELVQRNLLTQEEERQRIAAHLHDDIGSKLGVLHLSFHRLTRLTPQTDEHREMVAEINDLIANALNRVRSISHELLPPTLEDFGLIEALKELSEQVRKTGAVDMQLDCALERADLGDAQTELQLFRIVQELSNNTLKYAKASRIAVRLAKTGRQKQLTYRDDGQGFDPALTERQGLGLKNLESRSKMIGATLRLHTAPGKGFEAIVLF